MSDEPRYTEAEWRAKAAKEECARQGHDFNIVGLGAGGAGLVFDVLEGLTGEPVEIICLRCAKSWTVKRGGGVGSE